MAKRVLITRAQPQADATARRVRGLGHEPIVLPLTRTLVLPDGADGVRAMRDDDDRLVLATSARVLDALHASGLEAWAGRRRWAVVGSRAADRLAALGARLALPPSPTVSALVEALETLPGADRRAMVYLAAADRRDELEARFADLQVIALYEARALGGFDAEALAALRALRPDAALVYSRRGAHLLAQALSAGDLEAASGIVWLCLSHDVARAAPRGARCMVAASPSEAALLSLLA